MISRTCLGGRRELKVTRRYGAAAAAASAQYWKLLALVHVCNLQSEVSTGSVLLQLGNGIRLPHLSTLQYLAILAEAQCEDLPATVYL